MNDASDLAAARRRMIKNDLRGRGIHAQTVLHALERVPRERFIAAGARALAYADQALQIDCEQTISQPYIVAIMTESLRLAGTERVLEIGTGSGYQTAVLAELAAEVFTIERHEQLSSQARTTLVQLGYPNIHFHVGDGSQGWPEHASFDRILVTAATAQCPSPLWEQLVEGGTLVGPFGDPQQQILEVRQKAGGQSKTSAVTPCRFVPLVAGLPG
jgi:protein-L-isoaspartate(D-aspartate) O-methyltransferase